MGWFKILDSDGLHVVFYIRVNKYFILSKPSKSSILSLLFYFLKFFLADVPYLEVLTVSGGMFYKKGCVEPKWDNFSTKQPRENVYDRVYLGKITSLRCADCNSNINRLHHILFSEYVSKQYVLDSTTEGFSYGFCKIALFKILELFLRDIFVIPFLAKLQTSNL